MKELQKTVKKIKNNKSPGNDNVQRELIKMGGYDLHRYLHETVK
jgi:hypothetical protein